MHCKAARVAEREAGAERNMNEEKIELGKQENQDLKGKQATKGSKISKQNSENQQVESHCQRSIDLTFSWDWRFPVRLVCELILIIA